ncbi:jg15488 [Pararge aegeria aegeria]|uniref:Jg15488 protein n=1 Tax=Pararge aegeria aegeria TaxID=348720 RepID=A0A8S4R7N6_9NEOP|nr:jg15488 [Pararge aegeria aegeria]
MHRNPAKVMLPFEHESKVGIKKEKVIELGPDALKKVKNEPITPIVKAHSLTNSTSMAQEKSQEIKGKRETMLKKRKFYLSQRKVFDDKGEIIYEKLKENDGRISSLLVKLKSKKERLRTGQMFVEGWRLIVDGLEAKCNLKYLDCINVKANMLSVAGGVVGQYWWCGAGDARRRAAGPRPPSPHPAAGPLTQLASQPPCATIARDRASLTARAMCNVFITVEICQPAFGLS